MTAITVFGKPNCVQCKQTVKAFEKAGLQEGEDFTYRDVTEDPRAYAYVTEELGYSAAPVVVLDDQDHWSGYNPLHNRRAITWAHAQRPTPAAAAPALDTATHQQLQPEHPAEARAPTPATSAATTAAPAGVIDLSARLAQMRADSHHLTAAAATLAQLAGPTPAPRPSPAPPLPAAHPGLGMRA
ncbi:glutaredoxin family protein [Miniimonas arenae]|uniref:Glutaredoxin family protein n=1 Tax=Miniimonas arenae TaxID=676201 RepID=A0A5C5B758_9MICO|nr:glutaredoxin family protein [Miniimonas arenae]